MKWVAKDNSSTEIFQVSGMHKGGGISGADDDELFLEPMTQIKENVTGYYAAGATKLPGRPLTTDDLMLVLSGKKVMVECWACDCDGVRSHLTYSHRSKTECADPFNSIGFEHEAGTGMHLAYFQNGHIVWSRHVEGNVYVVSE